MLFALQDTPTEPTQPGAGFSESLRLLDLPEPWVLVMIILPLLVLISWIGYGGTRLSGGSKALLTALRMASLGCLLIVLFRPVLVERRETVRPAEVLLVVDDSASMRRRDAYAGDAETRTAMEAIAKAKLEDTSRIDLAKRALQDTLVPHLDKGGYQVKFYRFGADLSALANLSDLSGAAPATHLGDALTRLFASGRGRHITDVVVVSDGRSNGGLSPLEAARTAAARGVPVHSVVVGDLRPEKNVLVELVETPESVLAGDEVAVSVRVSARGLKGGERARVLLEEFSGSGSGAPRLLAEELVELSESGRRAVLVAPQKAPELGVRQRRFRVSVAPLPDENLRDDNQAEFSVRIESRKIRVLYLDGYPRWEYRFLKEILRRTDANLDMHAWLQSATPDFPQERSPGLTPLDRVPTARKALLENYDVVILGDVNPYTISPDPAECDEFMSSLVEFVERGGGVIFQAGEYHNPSKFVGTPLESLLPVRIDSTGSLTFQGDTRQEFHPIVETPTTPHEVVRLDADPEVNRRLWETDEGLHGFYWYSPVLRAKAGSQVLLTHPTDESPSGERFPLLVSGYYPSGRTLFIGIDSTWLWRFHYRDRYHVRFWRQAVRWVALGRLKSGDSRYRLDVPQAAFDLGDRVPIEARVLDEDFRPSEEPFQKLRLVAPDGTAQDLRLDLVSGRPGVFRASVEVEFAGTWKAWIGGPAEREALATTEFEVVLPSRENADPTPDPEALQAIARLTEGRSVSLAHLDELFEQFPGDEERREPISAKLQDAWDRWLTLLMALGFLTAEWILRKRLDLV